MSKIFSKTPKNKGYPLKIQFFPKFIKLSKSADFLYSGVFEYGKHDGDNNFCKKFFRIHLKIGVPLKIFFKISKTYPNWLIFCTHGFSNTRNKMVTIIFVKNFLKGVPLKIRGQKNQFLAKKIYSFHTDVYNYYK